MEKFIFLLRPNIKPLTAEQIQKRTQGWRQLINELNNQQKLVDWQVFTDEGCKVSGTPERITDYHPVLENNEMVGGIITITAGNLQEAIEISKLCPVIDFGGSVEVRWLQPQPNHIQRSIKY